MASFDIATAGGGWWRSVTRWLKYFSIFLAISSNEDQPNNVTNLPKYAQHFAK